jgi:fluoroacetyl-CoA thioesterase
MGALDNVAIGMTARKTVIVTREMTISHFVERMPQVYATPVMIMHMDRSETAMHAHLNGAG